MGDHCGQHTPEVCPQIVRYIHRQGSGLQSLERKNLMDKTKVAVLEQHNAGFPVSVKISLVVKGIPASGKIRMIKDRIRRSEHVEVFQKHAAADVAARHHPTGIR